VVLLLAFTYKLARTRLALCLLLQTLVFVAYNKVVTAQYFTWFACLIPVALAGAKNSSIGDNNSRHKHYSSSLAVGVALAWTLALALWLWRAHALEMLGQSTFLSVWIASLIFHVVQVAAIACLYVSLV
jgi:phosphatidylinositol glycan class M